jgi:hypothetical protein
MILTDIEVSCPDCGDTGLIATAVTELRNSIHLRMENSGQTPAYRVSPITNWIDVNDRPNVRLPNNFDFPDAPQAPDAFNSLSDIGKDKHKDSAGPIPEADIARFRDAAANGKTMFIYGHIDYCDVFHEPHSTAFCFRFKNAGTNLPICDRYSGEIIPKHEC